jgi:hypothetical protein
MSCWMPPPERDVSIVSELVQMISELVVQQLLAAEQADFLGGRRHYQRREGGQRGLRNGYKPRRVRARRGSATAR